MNIVSLLALVSISVGGCNTAGGETNKGGKVIVEDTTKVSASPLPFFNGVTDVNRGLKTGPVQVKGTLPSQNQVPVTLYLYEIEGRTTFKIDSARVQGGQFDFGSNTLESGVYNIGTNDQNIVPVILNPSEPVVQIAFRTMKLDNGPTAPGSKENQGWFAYYPQEIVLLQQIKDNLVAQAKSSLKDKFNQVILQKQTELANLQGKMINDYPDTYFAKLLTWKQEPDKNDKAKYWNNIDFSDESLIHSMVMPDRIQNYMRTHSGGQENGFLNCVDAVVEKAKVNERVLEFSLYSMLSGFYESGMENISSYITDNYIFGDGCGDAEISNVLKSKAEGIANLRVGKTPPNIQMTTLEGQNFDLYKTSAKNKYTLVMFWSSWCEHCKGEAPEVVKRYQDWHPKGFEMVGVSVDTSRPAWENAIKERGFVFPNVVGMKLWDSKVARDYKVTKTPTFFLLNEKSEIVLKPKGIYEVHQYLTQHLK